MLRAPWLACLALSASLAACGDSIEAPLAPIPPQPPNPDPTLNGTFQATFNTFDDLVLLQGSLQLFLLESAGTLTGTFVITGTIDDGGARTDVAGGGTLTGVIGPGTEASPLSFTAVGDYCAHSSDYTGVYLRTIGLLGIEGVVDVLDNSCTILHAFPLSVALGR